MMAAVRWRTLAVATAIAVAAGCATRTPAPVVERTPPSVPGPETAPIVPAPPVVIAAPAPPTKEKDWRPEFYTVKRGDTLYGIALEHGLDYRELAAMNNIENINVIRIGQVMRMRPPGDPAMTGPGAAPPAAETRPASPSAPVASVPRGNSETYKSGPKAVKLPFSEAAFAQLMAGASKSDAGTGTLAPASPAPASPATAAPGSAPSTSSATASNALPPPSIPPVAALVPPSPSSLPAAPPAPPPQPPSAPPTAGAIDSGDDRVDWAWPVRGRVINGYSESASLKGIDIGGSAGIPILSSASGKVVYAGSGLRGYGKLVIVKHNKTYLSAYAHLDQISVKEGQAVNRGQELGKMGNTDADQVKLHFEIRSLGKPVDPLRYLPRG
jgi:lipoprotein NlpD